MHTESGSLVHLGYASVAIPGFSREQIIAMLRRARLKNETLGITGMLLFSDTSFLQVIEGPRTAVETLFTTIREDSRHRQVVRVFERPISRRTFDTWSMGLAFLERNQLEEIPGCNDFFREGHCLSEATPSIAKRVLEAFKEGFWQLAVR